LQPEDANRLYQESEPKFVKLQKYLDSLVGGYPVSEEEMAALSASRPSPQPVAKKEPQVSFIDQAKSLLKQMLELFKQNPTPENRQKLGELCANLAKLEPKQGNWQNLTKTCHKAIANPKYPYKLLAPVIIKELKQGIDLIVLKKPEQIAPSSGLEQLASASLPQILITVDPETAAISLKKAFNKNQLSKLVQLLS
jgi:hypothetical protein